MDVLKKLKKLGGVFTDKHFVYQSEKHGAGYANIDPLLPHTRDISKLGKQLAEPFMVENFDTVVSPATGGIVLGYATALWACWAGSKEVMHVFAEKQADGTFAFERQGFASHVKGKRVLVVDDIMTNPNERGSVYKLCRLIEDCGGTVIGVSLVCNRCEGTAEQLKVPKLVQLSELSFTAMEREDCEATGLCGDHVPIVTDIGHGAEFQESSPDYQGGYAKLLSN